MLSQEFISSFMNLGFYFRGNLTSGFPEPLLIWGSGKAESMQQCLQAVQCVWKKHQWWSARGNHWDQSPAARAPTLNWVATEQHVKLVGKWRNLCEWQVLTARQERESVVPGHACGAECLAFLSTGTAPCPGEKPALQHRAHVWAMLTPGDQPWECGLLLLSSKSAKGDKQETIINYKVFLLITLNWYKQRCKNLKIYLKCSIQNKAAWKPVCHICLRVIKIKEKNITKPTYLFTPSCRQKKPKYTGYILKLLPFYTFHMYLKDSTVFINIGGDLKECFVFV